jgi:hypothetical protein
MADIKHDFKRYLSDHKPDKWLRRVLDNLLEVTGSERLRRFEAIALEGEKIVLEMLVPALVGGYDKSAQRELEVKIDNSQAMQRLRGFYATMADKLLERKDPTLYLFTFRRVRDPEVIAAGLNEEGGTEQQKLWLISRGLMRFQSAYLSKIGDSGDLAISFALSVISVWEGDLRSGSVDPEKTGVFKLSDAAGCANIFLQMSINTPDEPNQPDSEGYVFDQCLAFDEKAWLKRLVEMLPSSYAAEEVLASILHVCSFTLHKPWYEAFGEYDDDPAEATESPVLRQLLDQHPGDTQFAANMREWASYLFQPCLRLSEPHASKFREWRDAYSEKVRSRREAGERTIQWFKANEAEIEREFDRRTLAIMDDSLRTLRAQGGDHVEIEVAALRNAGIRGIVFRSEGHQFPDVGVEIIVRQETPTLVTFRTELHNFELRVHPEIVVRGEHAHEEEALAAMLEFAVVDAYYRIVAASTEARERRSWQKTGDSSAAVKKRKVSVRGFKRPLRIGQKASEAARKAYLATYGHDMPPGITFVKGYMRDQVIQYAISTTPAVKYRDNDLFTAVEWS